MKMRINEYIVERIFECWSKVEAANRDNVIKELKNLSNICELYYTMASRHFGPYNAVYDLYMKNLNIEMPIMKEFLENLESISKEAYKFITEGHDIANLKAYVALESQEESRFMQVLFKLKNLSNYLEYSFVKILNEPNKSKKLIILRGLVGM